MTSDQEKQEKDPSDHDDRSEGRNLTSVEDPAGLEDPAGFPDDPKLECLMMSEEERNFETFTLASPNVLKSMTSWRASRENTKVYSLAKQVYRQALSVDPQALARDQVNQVQGQACKSGPVSSPVASSPVAAGL